MIRRWIHNARVVRSERLFDRMVSKPVGSRDRAELRARLLKLYEKLGK